MANELQLPGGNLTFIKGVQNVAIPIPALSITVTGQASIHGQVALTTGDLNLNKGLIGTIGWIYIKNLDVTNNAQIGSDGILYPILLAPGGWILTQWNAVAVHAKATASTPNIEYLFVEL